MPRPGGRATHVIYTEYDLPRDTIEPHDVIVDKDGMAVSNTANYLAMTALSLLMFGLAVLFLRDRPDYMLGLILIGLALSRGPDKPKVAIVNELPAGQTSFSVGGQHLDVAQFANELFKSVKPVTVKTRAEAVAKVRSGEVLGALIVPPDATKKLQDAINLAGTTPPTVEVLYNGDDPLRAQLAESTIKSRLADANKALSDKLTQLAAQYLRILLKGGDFSLLGQKFDVLGLERSKASLEQTLSTLPPDSQQARDVKQVIDFAQIAIENLGLSDKVLAAVGAPAPQRASR